MDPRPRFSRGATTVRPTVSGDGTNRRAAPERPRGSGGDLAAGGRQALRRDHGGRRARPRGPAGVCFGLLGPNGAGKSTTMRMLTAQALADEGSIEVLGFALPRESKQARMEMGVVPQLDNLDVELTCRQILSGVRAAVPRPARGARARRSTARSEIANLEPRADTIVRRALGRDAPAAARGARADPPAAPGAARRADGRPRPAGPPGAVVADRRAAGRRRDGADVHALHRGGRAARRHRRGDVGRADHRAGNARRARQQRTPGDEVLEVYGPPHRLAEVEATRDAARLARTGAAARRSRSCGPRPSTATRPRACGARPTSRMRSWRSPGEEIE